MEEKDEIQIEQDNSIENELFNQILTIKIVSEPIHNNLKENLGNLDSFYKCILDQCTNSTSQFNDQYNEVYWDLVNLLVRSLNFHSKDWDYQNTHQQPPLTLIIVSILEWLSLNSSAREFLLVIEEFQVSSFVPLNIYTRVILVDLSKLALKRVSVEKRVVFLKSLLPPMIRLLESGNKHGDMNEKEQHSLGLETDEKNIDDEGDDNIGENEGLRILGAAKEETLIQCNTIDDLKWEHPLSSILSFINCFAADLKLDSIDNSNRSDPVAEQQHLLLQSLLDVLSMEVVLCPPQSLHCRGIPIAMLVGEILSLLGVPSSYILSSDKRLRKIKREMDLEDLYLDEGLDDDDFIDDKDLHDITIGDNNKNNNNINNNDIEDEDNDDDELEDDNSLEVFLDLALPYNGIGHLFYLLLMKSNETYRLPSIVSAQSLLLDNLPYLVSLLQHPQYKIGFKAIQMISFLEKRIKPFSINISSDYLQNPFILDVENILEQNNNNNNSSTSTKWIFNQPVTSIDSQYHFIQLVECMINFLVKCPVQKIRSFAYKVFVVLISTLSPGSRFNLLSTLIKTCVFPSFTGLLVHQFKDQIDHAWSSSSSSPTDLKAYFVSPKIVEVVTIPLSPSSTSSLMERMDSIMNGLNLYRYLLIRDKDTNYTSLWSPPQIQASRNQSLLPLQRDLKSVQSEFNSASKGDEKATQKILSGVQKMGLDELSNDEIKQASTLVVFHLDMALDVIDRIFELQDTLKQEDQ